MYNLEGNSPLIVAAMLANEELLLFMLEKYKETFSSSINLKDKTGRTALHYFALNLTKFKEKLQVAKLLIECGADFTIKDNFGANSFLTVCLAKYQPEPEDNNQPNLNMYYYFFYLII